MYSVSGNYVVQATIRGTLLNQQVMTTLHWRLDPATPPFANGSTLLDNIWTVIGAPGALISKLVNALPGNMGEIVCDLQWIYPLRYRKQTYVPAVNIGGDSVSTTTNLACVLTLTGEAANRRTICNKHIPMSQANADSGLVDAGYVALILPYATALQADIVTVTPHTLNAIIWGKPRQAYEQCGRTYPALPDLRTPITNVAIQDTVRVMRRRTVRVGI